MTAVAARQSTLRSVHDRLRRALPGEPLATDPTGITGWTYLWLALSLLFAAFCGLGELRAAFVRPYTVQDDSRTFLFWMARFTDPALFQNDLIADYFASASPPGYTALNWVSAVVFGLDPFILNKFLPLILGLVATAYVFRLAMALLPVPAAAFAAATILNESIWLSDAITSGTPRAFIYPIFAAFLFYLVSARPVRMLASVALLGLFYPQMLTIAVGTLCLTLMQFERGVPRLARERRAYLVCAVALLVALPLVGWAALLSEGYGPTITADQARDMLEFEPGGRTQFFVTDPWKFWISGERSGILPFIFKPPLIWLGAVLPLLALTERRLPSGGRLSPRTSILVRLALASFGMYAAAHVLLFRLHLPSRYTQHSLRLVLAISAGLALILLLEWVGAAIGRIPRLSRSARIADTSAVLLAAFGVVLLYPTIFPLTGGTFPYAQYVTGRETGLYDFLAGTPKDSVIASLTPQADLIPTFAKRSVLTGHEYAIPYHTAYYSQIRQRTHDLLRMQYTLDSAEVRRFFATYRVTHLLLDRAAFTREYVQTNGWMIQTQPEVSLALASLDTGREPVVAQAIERCQRFTGARYVLLDGACVVAFASGQ